MRAGTASEDALHELLRERPSFDPRRHEAELVPLISKILALEELNERTLNRILKQHPRDGKALFSRSQIIAGFRAFARERAWSVPESDFTARLRKRRVRTLSGVAPVTVLTKPFPCPGKCIFCPSDVRMPKSYLSREPGAQRAAQQRFDPYLQTSARLRAFHELGHPIDKVELIVLGGTWSFYPEPYRVWFIARCFQALNEFGQGLEPAPALRGVDFLELSERVDGGGAGRSYNQIVGDHLRRGLGGSLHAPAESASWDELDCAQRLNEDAACRCVGLSLETRPDHVDAQEVQSLRRLGATKIQLGYQSLRDSVLQANQRGHSVDDARRATDSLRGAGFKIHAHWMPNLMGSSPELDRKDYARLFDDPQLRPDELKLYPCSLIPSAELMHHHRSGQWAPYSEEELIDLVADCMLATPVYCRLTRVIRDISAQDIAAGSRTANLREVAERRLIARGLRSRDIRAREIRDGGFEISRASLRQSRYRTGVGEEHFMQFATPDDRLLAFLRLSLPDRPAPIPELGRSAVIREVHVYGALTELGRSASKGVQHLGLGATLIEHAAKRARHAGYANLAVISAVGTRRYYERLGFRRGELYHHRELDRA